MLLLNLKDSGNPKLITFPAIKLCARWTAVTAGTSLVAALSVAYIDTLYYHGTLPSSSPAVTERAMVLTASLNVESITNALSIFLTTAGMQWDLVFTPINLFKFNSNPRNLEQFGLHPWWMHAVLNTQILYGPLALIAVFICCILGFRVPYHSVSNQAVTSEGCNRATTAISERSATVRMGLLASSICGIAALSVAPHQEPRFLLPAGLGICALAAPFLWRRQKMWWYLWLLFNIGLGSFYTLVHQAGVVRSLRDHASTPPHHHLVYYASYMPPRSFAGARGKTVYDFHKAEGLTELMDMFKPLIVQLREQATVVKEGGSSLQPVLSIALPGSVSALQVSSMLSKVHKVHLQVNQPVSSYWPHFSGEHPPQQLADLSLFIYRAQFDNNP